MDYEKALSKAREFYNARFATDSENEMLEQIFPQLRESEDEKIREGLIALIKNWNYPQELFTTKQNILDWLEKQGEKEQKVPEQCLKCNEYEIGYKAGYTHGCTAGYNRAVKEADEQKEQKPAELATNCSQQEWSEEDEKMLKGTIEAISAYIEDLKETNGRYVDILIKTAKKERDWLEERLKLLRPQPKQEWGEEEMKALKQVVDATQGELHEPLLSLYYKLLEQK